MEAILTYAAVSVVLGGIVAAIVIWTDPDVPPPADGRGAFLHPKIRAIGIGLFVAVVWPLLLIGSIL
jgi:hypothetical protein